MTTPQEQSTITKYDLYYESRMTKIETLTDALVKAITEIREDVREIRSDIRWVFGIMLGFTSIILTLMARGFHWFT